MEPIDSKRGVEFSLSSELLERGLSAAAEGITIADANLPDRPLIYCNEGFEQLTGYSRAETLGRNCRFLQGGETDPGTVDEIREAVIAGRESVVEILNYRKDGTPFWNRLSITPVHDDAGNLTHFIGVQSDVTVRRKAEEALREANDKLRSINQEMSRDLQLAARVQQSLLPRSLPSIPGVNIAWAVEPCDELAGDTLGMMQLSGTELGMFVVDVSGHGVAASLLSVSLMHWFDQRFGSAPGNNDTLARESYTPVAVAESLNRDFPMDMNTGQYFTIVYGVLDTSSRRFRYVCAGHPSPVHIPHDGIATATPTSNFPVGITPEPGYDECVIQLCAGDCIFLYSDGLTEAENSDGVEFGIERVLEQVSVKSSAGLDGVVKALLGSVADWAGHRKQIDDVSVLGVEIS